MVNLVRRESHLVLQFLRLATVYLFKYESLNENFHYANILHLTIVNRCINTTTPEISKQFSNTAE